MIQVRPVLLVADDNPAHRLAVRRALRGIDVDIHEAASGFDALSLSLTHDYALILLDVRMPDMDGFEVCGRLRADPRTAETAVILMTAALVAPGDALAGYAEGATDYLTKPISDHLLRAKVQVFLRLHHQTQALRTALAAAEAARAEAERATLARAKFLAAASHDLRQPVHSLMLLLDVLKPLSQGARVDKAVTCMESALTGLQGLLASLLDLSRLDAGVVMPQVEQIDIGGMVSRLAGEYVIAAQAKGLRLRCVAGREGRAPARALTDPAMLERVLRNLIENALRYTPSGGILVGVRRRGGRLSIEVVDSGIGIDAEHRQHIFEEFYQVGNPSRDRTQGLGLGLSLVARLARLLGVEITVASRPGRGTRFSLLLPSDRSEEPRRGCVLVIEDNPALLSSLARLIEGWGYQVVAAGSAEEALATQPAPGAGIDAPGAAIDAIVADHRLGPGPTGCEVAREIQRRRGRPLPTLIVTGEVEPQPIAEMRAGGFDVLHKPVGADELRRRLADMVHPVAAVP